MAMIHDRIRQKRFERGMTLAQVAEHLGVTEATAQRYETGKGIKSIPYKVLEKYSELFGVSPAYFLGWDEPFVIDFDADKLVHEASKSVAHYKRVLAYLDKLNDAGIVKLVERAEELAEMKKYLKEEGDN